MAIRHFDVPHRSRHCLTGNEEFVPGAHYYSLLEPLDAGGYSRKDFCLKCWHDYRTEHDLNHEDCICWKSRVPLKREGPDPSLKRNERAFQLLQDISQSSDPAEINEAFVLALLLSRSKMLHLRQELVDDEGQEVLLYEVVSTEQMLPIQRVELSDIQTEEVQQSLAGKLNVHNESRS